MTHLDPSVCYRAVRSRDARFDGRFFTGVLTTGVYCRPICPARLPLLRNVRFFASAAAAEAEGFRPCMRCRPETSPGTPAWVGTSASVSRALRLIDEGFLDESNVDELAARVGMTSRHLRRLFEEHLGATPVAVAQARRVHFARRLVDETRLSITDIAYTAGFASVRRFNHVFRRTFARSPSEFRLRQKPGARTDGALRLRLSMREPFDWERLIGFLGARAIDGIEEVRGGCYRRVVVVGDDAGVIEVKRPDGNSGPLVLHVPVPLVRHALWISGRTRRLFDLAADPEAIASALSHDAMLAPLVSRYPGLRIPGTWTPLETTIRAVLGQQVSVKGASTMADRLVAACGEKVETGDPHLTRRFPEAARLRRARLERIGLTGARIRCIRAIAAAVDDGTLTLGDSKGLDDAIRQLTALEGVGPWTAHYVSMRVCAEPDAFPSGDLALRRAAQALEPSLNSERKLVARAEVWRPWRAYATMLLWAWYSEHA